MAMNRVLPTEQKHANVGSQQLYQRALRLFPDGTTRVTVERNPEPIYALRGEGAYLIDVDGRRLLDLNNNFTTLIHGHGFRPIIEAVHMALENGTCFANPTESEIRLADLLKTRIPSIERIRFVNSGTEAVMFAIKAARAFTGKTALACMEGSYHGAYDWAEVGQGRPASTSADAKLSPTSAYRGAPKTVCDDVVVCRFNDVAETEKQISQAAHRLACILIDPMPSRAGLLPPDPSFVDMLTHVARKYNILIVADEVLNLRQGFHGACARYGLQPDLIVLGKIIGGGFPIGAIGGRQEVMKVFSALDGRPSLPQGGTFSANPISMTAGRVAMEEMTEVKFKALEVMGHELRQGIQAAIRHHGEAFCITGQASLFRIHPKSSIPADFRQTRLDAHESATMNRLIAYFLERDILLPNGAAACLSTAMTNADVRKIIDVFNDFLGNFQTVRLKGL